MKIVSFLLFGGLLFGISDAWATENLTVETTKRPVAGRDIYEYRSHWGASSFVLCPSDEKFESDDGCLGNCVSGTTKKWAMLANQVNERGAKFCLTWMESTRILTVPQTIYGPASASQCVWLCKDGWTGDQCKTAVNSTTKTSCNPTPFKQTTYVNMTDGPKREADVAMFTTVSESCGDKRFGNTPSANHQEHDLVLGVSEWLSSGHGAYVEPMTVRAWCPRITTSWFTHISKTNSARCEIMIARRSEYANGSSAKQLVCMDGYKPNSDKTDCVAINQTVCTNVEACNKWDATIFKDTSKPKKVVVNGCNQYRCAKDGYGFAGDPFSGQITCVECPTSMRQGISETNGQCLQAAAGQIVSDGKIVTATETSRSQMTDAGGDDPCWLLETAGEYKKCVLGLADRKSLIKYKKGLILDIANITQIKKPNNNTLSKKDTFLPLTTYPSTTAPAKFVPESGKYELIENTLKK